MESAVAARGLVPRGSAQANRGIQSGMVAAVSATTPDATRSCTQASTPWHRTNMRMPVIPACAHWRGVGTGAPARRAQAYSAQPATAAAAPRIMKGGKLSIA